MAKEPATLAMVIQLLNRQGREIDLMHHELHQILEKITIMQTVWDDFKVELAELTTVTAGVKSVVDKLISIIETGPTLADVRAEAAKLKANREELAAAVVKGTGASGEPTTEPPV